MPKKNEPLDYQAKSAELDAVLERLQDADIQVDEATDLYKKGQELIGELETYLNHAENTVRTHTATEN